MGCQPLDRSRLRTPVRISRGLSLSPMLLRRLELSLELSKASPLPVRFSLADDLGWIPDCDSIAGNISCNNGARPYEGVLVDGYSGRDENERSDLAIVTDCDAFFDVDISVYFRVLADSTAVKVYLIVDSGAFPYLRFLDNGILWATGFHFAGISVAEGIWTCIVRS